MRKFVLCFVLLFMLASPSYACIGARQAAMGWAGVACSDDATVAYWNPALIPFTKSGVSFDTFCSVIPNCNPRILFTSQSFIGNHIGITHTVNQTREYYMISYAQQVFDDFSLSVGVSIDFKYGQYQGYSLIFSGVCKHDWLTLAVLAQDTNIRPSVAIATGHIIVCLEVYDAANLYERRHLRLGSEVNFSQLAIRVGYTTREGLNETSGFSYGLGVNISDLKIDFTKFKEDLYGVSVRYAF
jgi:hypothetical protein